jgi:glutathione peroxidase
MRALISTPLVITLAAACAKPAPAPASATSTPTPTATSTPAPSTETAPAPAAKEAAPAVVYGDTAKAQDPMQLPAAGTAPTPVHPGAEFGAIWTAPIHTLKGAPTTLGAQKGKALLIVNVASKCGFTPQYAALEAIEEKYKGKGFEVVGFPCNQFGKQEPGSAEEIQTFCSTTYGVTFPMMEKIDVNGEGRHAIYKILTAIPDSSGKAGDIGWNFEKFVVSADGKSVTRFRSPVKPDDPSVLAAIENGLPKK